MGRRYPSKQDLWLSGLILGGLAFASVAVLLSPDPTDLWLRVLIALALPAFVAALIYPLFYEVRPEELFVRAGVFSYRVPGYAIRSVKPTRNPLSAPAMSLDRLEVRYEVDGKEKMLLISPAQRDEFLVDLRAIAPQLRLVGEELMAR